MPPLTLLLSALSLGSSIATTILALTTTTALLLLPIYPITSIVLTRLFGPSTPPSRVLSAFCLASLFPGRISFLR
ncbi:hypothetical protein BU16DRAFT_530072 [Lophium mytilinum]|uniref:Uncharacterized protein n=1 Tax=Lophium mytilinum TaxID=390894 RepID=A0A6A6QHM4_9PEZI|nr:hypothetical protein BU16DRAFT_530072 [Lophium mytilinum]